MGRVDLLRQLPSGGRVAEVGVAAGAHAALILEICQPAELHLIDHWPRQAGVNHIRERFAPQIAAGQVHIHRGKSAAALAGFSPGYFDWVYIDAGHGLASVLADLRAAEKVTGEFIAGHDYIDPQRHPRAKRNKWGVIEAVAEFCKGGNWELVFSPPTDTEAIDNSGFILKRFAAAE
jgi:hypothetical protein